MRSVEKQRSLFGAKKLPTKLSLLLGSAIALAGCSSDMMRFSADETSSVPQQQGFAAVPIPSVAVPNGSGQASTNYSYNNGGYDGPRDLTSQPLTSQPMADPYQQQAAYVPQQTALPVRSEPVVGYEGERFQQFVTVQPGDTLYSIGNRYGMSASQLAAQNGIGLNDPLHAGQQLSVAKGTTMQAAQQQQAPQPVAYTQPRQMVQQPANGTYVVQPGDTLYGIARSNGVSATQLAAANGMTMQSTLKVGQRLSLDTSRAPQVAALDPAPAPVRDLTQPVVSTPVVQAQPLVQQAPKPVQEAANTQVRVVTPNPHAQESQLVKKVAIQPEQTPAERVATTSFRWPATGRVISGFGKKPDGTHNDGIDIAVPEGTPVKVAENGVVVYAGSEIKGYGNLILVRHADDYVTAYAHNKDLLVKRGDTVTRGQDIALAGQTGSASSPRIHFEIRKGAKPVNPSNYLP